MVSVLLLPTYEYEYNLKSVGGGGGLLFIIHYIRSIPM
jgi:hypothetical protein